MRLADDPAFDALLRAALLALKRDQLERCHAAPWLTGRTSRTMAQPVAPIWIGAKPIGALPPTCQGATLAR